MLIAMLVWLGCREGTAPPGDRSCPLPQNILSVGAARSVFDDHDTCGVWVLGCAQDTCAGPGPLFSVDPAGDVASPVADEVASVLSFARGLAVLLADGQLGVVRAGAFRPIDTDVSSIARLSVHAVVYATASGEVRTFEVGPDASPVVLSGSGVFLEVTASPVGVYVLEDTVVSTRRCDGVAVGALVWVSADGAVRTDVATDAVGVRALNAARDALVVETADAGGLRTFVVAGRGGGVDPILVAAGPGPVSGGCGGVGFNFLWSDAGDQLAYRSTRFAIETGGLGAIYPQVELAVVPTDSLTSEPRLVPCGPSETPVLFDDGTLLCNTPDGLGLFDTDGTFAVIAAPVVGLVPRTARTLLFQAFDDDAPLLEDVFRHAEVRQLDLDPSPVLSTLATGYLVGVHDDRFVVHSALPEAWLWDRPQDIDWHVLDLVTGADAALEDGLRPEGFLRDGALVVYGVWGPSEAPHALFVGGMP